MSTSILVLISFLFPVWGISPDCQNQVQEHGDGKGISVVSSSCMQEYKKQALPQAWKSAMSGFVVVGARDLIIAHKEQSVSVIAGSNTLLREVSALAIDSYNDEVVVYDQKTDYILFFSKTITGNVSPFRILFDPRLKGTVDLAVDGIKGELYVLNQERREIQVYSRMANINGREGKKNLDLIRKITGISQNVHSLGLASSFQELYLLEDDKLATYALNNTNFQHPLRVIKHPSLKSGYASLSYLQDRDELLIFQEGKRMYLPRDGK